MSRRTLKASYKLRINSEAAVNAVFNDRGNRWEREIKSAIEALSDVQFDQIDWESKSSRRKVVGSIRRAIRESTEKPEWSGGLFERLKSERRDVSARKSGSGINARVEGPKFVVEFYATNDEHKRGSSKYGFNHYWAIQNALYGRGPIAKDDGPLGFTFDKPRVRSSAGYENPFFAKYVRGVDVNEGWFDNAMDDAASKLARSFTNGRR